MPDRPDSFQWSNQLDPEDFLFATYRVTARCSGEEAAIGMAMEQSASTLSIAGYATPDMLSDWTVRVCRVESIAEESVTPTVPGYFLNTEVYAEGEGLEGAWEIELAVPQCLVLNKPVQLLNVLVGEMPRLGFLTSFRLLDLRLSARFGPGPAFGRQGILGLLDKQSGPLLCRAMRPGVGLDLETMARLNHDVLLGGFHLVKDDELICFGDLEAYRLHLERMLRARDEAMDASGERKLYIANLFCEPDELEARWDLACELGVDGVLVAPFIQGPGVVSMLARRGVMPLLAHNSFADLLSRHPSWGVDDAALCQMLRRLGADWFVTPGLFTSPAMNGQAGSRMIAAATGETAGLRAMMPNIQGGKHPGGLPEYRAAVGDDDYMLIVAHWVDSHPEGLQRAARIFREAVDGQ
jgi:ribulose 1,5-bisphosphate carboxylase large subunit-like protein